MLNVSVAMKQDGKERTDLEEYERRETASLIINIVFIILISLLLGIKVFHPDKTDIPISLNGDNEKRFVYNIDQNRPSQIVITVDVIGEQNRNK